MSTESIQPNEPSKRFTRVNNIIIGFGILLVIAVIVGVATGFNTVNKAKPNDAVNPAQQTSTPTPTVENNSWIPNGYINLKDGFAIKWMTPAQDNASSECTGDHCWGAYLVSRDGCPSSLYVEFNYFNSQDVQLGYTNDSVGSVAPGTKVQVMFNTYESSARTGQISKISCY
jgi:hypothetical protein